MAIFRGNIYSKTLDLETGVTVVLPQDQRSGVYRGKMKTLYLLHGLSRNNSTWVDRSTLVEDASIYNVAVVMPEAGRNFYTDNPYGCDYEHYIAEELPELCEKMFGFSSDREDRYIGGLSMGGYGSVMITLKYPHKFAGCAAFSAVSDMERLTGEQLPARRKRESVAIFGQTPEQWQEHDIYRLIEHYDDHGVAKPKFAVWCGTQDHLMDDNIALRDALKAKGFSVDYRTWEGDHDWKFWTPATKLILETWFEKTLDENLALKR